MKEVMKRSFERLSPARDSQERMLDHILENAYRDPAPSVKWGRLKQAAAVFACTGICAAGISVIRHTAKNAPGALDTPVYACTISDRAVSLKKASNEIETSVRIDLKDQEYSQLQCHDSGYTISLSEGAVNGQILHFFFDITANDGKTISVDRQGDFSSLDMDISCKAMDGSRFIDEPVFEWFMLEDADPDDSRVQFGITLWAPTEADRLNITVSGLKPESSGKAVSGCWGLVIPLDSGDPDTQEKAQTFLSGQTIQYQGAELILSSVTYDPGTLTIVLEDPRGRLNQKPFVDLVLSIESPLGKIYPAYGSCTGEGTRRTLLYVLEDGMLPEDITAIEMDGLRIPIDLEPEAPGGASGVSY